MPPDRETLSHVEGDALTIAMVGELDMAREGELLNLVVTLDPPAGIVVDLDLSDLTFADSAGLRSIVNAQAYLRGRHCELRLVRPQRQLLRLIELVGITDYVTVVDGLRELVQDGEEALNG